MRSRSNGSTGCGAAGRGSTPCHGCSGSPHPADPAGLAAPRSKTRRGAPAGLVDAAIPREQPPSP
eukprot:8070016-Lingulodinium_polyedra.AAC.1